MKEGGGDKYFAAVLLSLLLACLLPVALDIIRHEGCVIPRSMKEGFGLV